MQFISKFIPSKSVQTIKVFNEMNIAHVVRHSHIQICDIEMRENGSKSDICTHYEAINVMPQ